MTFSPDTEKLVNELIQSEYRKACEDWGEKFNSLHEGYAVLLEEVEEVKQQLEMLYNTGVPILWESTKTDDFDCAKLQLNAMLHNTHLIMQELAQVGAVLWKIGNTISPVEKTENLEKTPKFVWHDYPNEEPKHQQKVLIQDRYGNIYTASYYTDKKDTCFSVQSLTYGLQGCEFIANEQVKKWCDFPLEVEE